MSWNAAHGVAMIAAAQAHEALGVGVDDYIDVFAALRQAGVEVVGQDLGGLLGLYVDASVGGLPGCLVNTGLEEVSMRHTAAHELGHHRLSHGTSIDHQAQSAGRWGEGWPQHERDAEAFASWFLMPRPAVRTALRRCQLQRPQTASDVYRLARWLGTPYATTVRHLVRLKMIDRQTEALWLKHSPGILKAELAGGSAPGPRSHTHVLLPAAHGATLHVSAGDVLRLAVPHARYDCLPQGLSPSPPAAGAQMSFLDAPEPRSPVRTVWVSEEVDGDTTVTATADDTAVFRVTVRLVPQRRGSDHFRT
ncbi:ImmA/IrrE family metallo-endopeptidase [Streptomyces sp. NPDC051956]|uniref:ImmA/IrrE family metallo-endopeptidase n=1 Tax=Streptomyces sp. NPDC051956 TaxID=3365677 RepID=UPI0037CE61A8